MRFFDSPHAAAALAKDLDYGDLDSVVKSVVEREGLRKSRPESE